MKTFLIVSLGIMALAAPFLALYFVANWKRWIWENKGRVFRIYKEKNYYYAEKKFLWFFIRCDRDEYYSSREEAIAYIQNFLKEIKQEQSIKKEKKFLISQIKSTTQQD